MKVAQICECACACVCCSL